MNTGVIVYCLIMGAVAGFMIGFFAASEIVSGNFHYQAIKRGFAEYNQTNGVWQWKGAKL